MSLWFIDTDFSHLDSLPLGVVYTFEKEEYEDFKALLIERGEDLSQTLDLGRNRLCYHCNHGVTSLVFKADYDYCFVWLRYDTKHL